MEVTISKLSSDTFYSSCSYVFSVSTLSVHVLHLCSAQILM